MPGSGNFDRIGPSAGQSAADFEREEAIAAAGMYEQVGRLAHHLGMYEMTLLALVQNLTIEKVLRAPSPFGPLNYAFFDAISPVEPSANTFSTQRTCMPGPYCHSSPAGIIPRITRRRSVPWPKQVASNRCLHSVTAQKSSPFAFCCIGSVALAAAIAAVPRRTDVTEAAGRVATVAHRTNPWQPWSLVVTNEIG